jgi:GH24 family phage-related lysozyme (muramidase)
VTGLTHTIQENEWLTKIKGQMIKLRENNNYGKSAIYNTTQKIRKAANSTLGPLPVLTGAILDDAVNLLKTLEGLYSSTPGATKQVGNATSATTIYAYLDSGGTPTIGWGTTLYKTGVRAGTKVTVRDTISLAQAEAELRAEAAEVYRYILEDLQPSRPLTNGELVALISLGYNAGLAGLSGSPMWQGLQGNTDKKVLAQQFLNYRITVKKGTVTVQGLINRRKQESQIFLS